MKNNTLTSTLARTGLRIISKNDPQWGTFTLVRDGDFWNIKGDRGERVLSEGEFHFWTIVAK